MCTDFRGSYISARSSFSEQLTGDKLSNDMITNDKFSSHAAELTNSLHWFIIFINSAIISILVGLALKSLGWRGFFRAVCPWLFDLRLCEFLGLDESSLFNGKSLMGWDHFLAFRIQHRLESDSLEFFTLLDLQLLLVLLLSFLLPSHHLSEIFVIGPPTLRLFHMLVVLFDKRLLFLLQFLPSQLLVSLQFLLLFLNHCIDSQVYWLMTNFLRDLIGIAINSGFFLQLFDSN